MARISYQTFDYQKLTKVLYFFRCGIWPVDRTQYPKKRFSKILLQRYETWVKEEKSDLSADKLDKIFNQVEIKNKKVGLDTSTENTQSTCNKVTYKGQLNSCDLLLANSLSSGYYI